MVDFGKNDMMPHFIYCNEDMLNYYRIDKNLKKLILTKMRKYGLPSSIFTTLRMTRVNLMTKEKSKQAVEGKLKNDPDWKDYKGSINDDLDSFVNNFQNSEVVFEDVLSYFIPKLTKEELKLVEQKNNEHMMTYVWEFDADVSAKEMKESDSKEKYLHSECQRRTNYLNLESEQTLSKVIPFHDFSENSSDDSSEDSSEKIINLLYRIKLL